MYVVFTTLFSCISWITFRGEFSASTREAQKCLPTELQLFTCPQLKITTGGVFGSVTPGVTNFSLTIWLSMNEVMIILI